MHRELKELLRKHGAALIGYADLTPLPADWRRGLPRGISFAVALDPAVIAGIAAGPTREYFQLYHSANEQLNELAEQAAAFLRSKGFAADAEPSTGVGIDWTALSARIQHKTVATRAGLGWVGKCALLITEPYGAAVRLGSVLTDAPLPVGRPVEESRCGDCTACTDICPAKAPSGRNWRAGIARQDFFDAFACHRWMKARMERAGDGVSICGMCIAACPWTKAYLKRSGL